MASERALLFKGFTSNKRLLGEVKDEDISIGVFYRWWRMLQLSQVFWFADVNRHPIADEKVADTYSKIGDIRNSDFRRWWSETGQYIFSEQEKFAKIREIDLETLDKSRKYKRSIILEVPLMGTKQQLLSDFRKIINKELVNEDKTQGSSRFNVMRYSTATFKLLKKVN
jgi:hypothetical protein